MTRKEAVKILKAIRVYECYPKSASEETKEAIDMAIEALSAEAVQGYTEWLEKIIVEAETFEWLCEETTDEEWCEKNCNYASIQAKCLRHLYEASKGGDEYEKCVEKMEHDIMYEPTYNQDDGSM